MKTHGQDIWACDFVPVVTLFFHTIHAFVIVHLASRRVMHFGVTEYPTDEWVAQQLREATPFGETPKHLICDNDKQYGPVCERVAKTSGIEVIHTPYQAPLANAICERFIGSLRRECLDHMLVLGMRQLVCVLTEYVKYFNQARPQQGIEPQLAESRLSPVPSRRHREYHQVSDAIRRGRSTHRWRRHRLPCVERTAPHVWSGDVALLVAG